MTRYDLDLFWRELPGDTTGHAAAAAYHVLARSVAGERVDTGELVRVLAAPAAGSANPAQVFQAVCDLLPQSRRPALLVSPPPRGEPTGWFAAALRGLEQVVTAVPALPVAAAVSAAEYERTVAGQTTRSVALAREGYTPVPAVFADDLAQRLQAAGVAPSPPDATLRRLTGDGLSEEAAAAFVRAAVAARAAARTGDDSEARSAAERLLYERLESLPETAGLFTLNRPLAFAHGPRPAEADLCAERLKLVVEVDGSYYHLTTKQYRLDRRKDWLYQRHGYLVLRFLAEDVVDDLDPVLDAILEAVALRRDPTP